MSSESSPIKSRTKIYIIIGIVVIAVGLLTVTVIIPYLTAPHASIASTGISSSEAFTDSGQKYFPTTISLVVTNDGGATLTDVWVVLNPYTSNFSFQPYPTGVQVGTLVKGQQIPVTLTFNITSKWICEPPCNDFYKPFPFRVDVSCAGRTNVGMLNITVS